MEFIGRARKGGVKITAGTDVTMPYVVPGAGLHGELKLLVDSGLTPMEALVSRHRASGRIAGPCRTTWEPWKRVSWPTWWSWTPTPWKT